MSKNTLIAVAAAAVLVVWAALSATTSSERGISRIDFSAAAPESITDIKLSGKYEASLKKEGEDWKVDGKRADGAAVKRLTDAIAKVKSSDLVTKSESRYEELEVDDAKGLKVLAMAGPKTVAEFTVGKASKGGTHVRKGDEVYSVTGVFPTVFGKDTAGWRDKKLFTVDKKDIAKASVKLASGTSYDLVKEGELWKLADMSVLPEGFRFDHAIAERVITTLAGLRVKEYVSEDPGAEATGLGAGFDSLTFSAGDTSYVVQLGKSTESGDVYGQVVGGEGLFLVAQYNVGNLRKLPTDMRDLKVIDVATDKVVALEITHGAEKVSFEKKEKDWSLKSSSPKPAEGFELDINAIARRLSSLARARAMGVAPEGTALGRTTAKAVMTLEDGSKVELVLGAETKRDDKSFYLAKGNIDGLVYEMASHQLNGLMGTLESFKKQPPPPMGGGMGGLGGLDPKTLESLPPEIRKQIEQQMAQQRMQQMMMEKMQAQK